MPFGLQIAPATFQRMVLADCFEYAAAYLDDVIIHSTCWEDHVCHVRIVLQKLRRAGLTIKPKKSQFGMDSCSYLGHVIGNGEVHPEKAKLQAVEEFPTPTMKKQVRAFLGLTEYYLKFISDFAEVAAPPTDLTKKDMLVKPLWTDDCERAFKRILCSEPILRGPDFQREFILQTDTAERGCAQPV